MSDLTRTADFAHTDSPAEDPPPVIGGYELLDEIGRGGMGVIYRARDLALGREVAVKLLQERYAINSSTARRFVDEARITAQLQHPGIPAVYQVGTWADGRPFLAMKLIRGKTLDQLLTADDPIDILSVFEAICHAVGYAHSQGVIHRDLKPANVMVGAHGEVQVMDWGLAKMLGPMPDRSFAEARSTKSATDPETTLAIDAEGREDATTRTVYGSVLGTPAFMAPEQASGDIDRVTERSDVFGLGGILCALLTGHPPHAGNTAEGVRLAAANGETAAAFARLDACPTSSEVIALCKSSLSFDPAGRPADGKAVAEAVAQIRRSADERAKAAERDRLTAEVRAGELRKRRRVLGWAGGVAVAVLLAGITGTSLGLIRADGERRAAEKARDDEAAARKEAEVSESVNRSVVRSLTEPSYFVVTGGRQPPGARRLEELAAGYAEYPVREARVREALGQIHARNTNYEEAARQHAIAFRLFTETLGPEDAETLHSRHLLAVCWYQAEPRGGPWTDRKADAVAMIQETLAVRRRTLPPHHPDLLQSLEFLALQAEFTNSAPPRAKIDGVAAADEALEIHRRISPPDSEEYANALFLLVYTLRFTTDVDRYVRTLDELLGIARRSAWGTDERILGLLNGKAERLLSFRRPELALAATDEAMGLIARGKVNPSTGSYIVAIRGDSFLALKRYQEALQAIDQHFDLVTAKLDPVNLKSTIAGWGPTVFPKRFRACQGLGDAEGCRATAARYESLELAGSQARYDAACFRAVTAGLFAQAGRTADAKTEADRAMELLALAVKAGYRNRAHITRDKDLDAVRDRTDFQKLLATLPPERLPSPRPAPEK